MIKDKDQALKLLSDAKATWFRVSGNGTSIKVEDKSPEDTIDEFSALWESLSGSGSFLVEFRPGKNDTKNQSSFRFNSGSGSGAISGPGSGLEMIGLSPAALFQQNEAMKQEIAELKRKAEIKEIEDRLQSQIKGLKEKDSGFDLGKLSPILGQITQILEATKRTPSSNPAPVSGGKVNSLSGLPDAERTGENGGIDPEEQIGNDLQKVAGALGTDEFIEVIAALGRSAEADPEAFKQKIKMAKGFL
jgi:hypothetical protein